MLSLPNRKKSMSFIKTIFCICLLSLTFQQTNAQFNVATGFTNTAIVNGACYRLTNQGQLSATGVIWSNAPVDLTCNFVRAYNVKFGNSDGADGMAFIMKNVANYAPTAGSNGGALAFDWVGNTNSFMIEFDTYNNSMSPSFDPTTSAQGANPDHIAFMRNGSVNHSSANNLAGPLATSDLENGAFHNVTISWIAATSTLTCVIDNNWTLTSVVNLTTILGASTTYFGWAATTGGITNYQEVCPLPNPPIVLPAETVNICPNANTPLDASIIDLTSTNLFTWAVTSGSGTVTTPNPADAGVVDISGVAAASTIQMTYTDNCGVIYTKNFNIQPNSSPSVTIANISICSGANWTLTPSSGTYDDLSWDITAGAGASDPITTGSTFSGTGGATIQVTPSITGCTTPGTPVTVTVTETSITPFSAGSDIIYCVANIGDNYTYANSNITVPAGFPRTWTTFDGTIISAQPNGTLVVNQTGHYILNTTGGAGCSAQDTVLITLVTTPVVTITGNINHCVGTTQTLSITGTFSTVTWNDGAANFATNSNNFDITQGGTYTVTVTQGTCSGTDNIVINQIVPVAPNAGNAISQCTNGNINLSGTGSAGYTYSWTTADGNIAAGANTLAPTVSTSGTYVLTATSPEGCIDDDDVFVELLPQPVPNLGSNFQACPDLPFTVNLNNFADYTSVLWSDNSVGATYTGTALSNGNVTVSVDVAINTCTATDQVTISAYTPPSWDLGAGATVCGNAPFTYTSTQNVLWQDGTLGNTYTQNNPVVGIETLTAVLTYGNNCIITDQADVNVLPPFVVDLPNTADFCEGGFVTINAGNDVYWNTGEFGPSVNCSTVGTLIATYDDGYCYSQDAMEITMTYLPFIDWGDSTTYCMGQSVMLGTIGSHATSFTWSTGETSEFISINEAGYYSLTASNSCGSAFQDVVLDFETCEAYAFIPNAFTPDQDGVNEAWVPVLYNAKSYEVFIYNRWGDMIFHSTNPNENWLGETHKGEYYNQDGVYHYRMILESPNREKKEYYGVFHLLR
jgi:gliding motility-associated-like protein